MARVRGKLWCVDTAASQLKIFLTSHVSAAVSRTQHAYSCKGLCAIYLKYSDLPSYGADMEDGVKSPEYIYMIDLTWLRLLGLLLGLIQDIRFLFRSRQLGRNMFHRTILE